MSDVHAKYKRAREVMLKWGSTEITDVIRDHCWSDSQMVDLILENDWVDIDEVLTEAGLLDENGNLIRLCGGAQTAEEERELYLKAMGTGQTAVREVAQSDQSNVLTT